MKHLIVLLCVAALIAISAPAMADGLGTTFDNGNSAAATSEDADAQPNCVGNFASSIDAGSEPGPIPNAYDHPTLVLAAMFDIAANEGETECSLDGLP